MNPSLLLPSIARIASELRAEIADEVPDSGDFKMVYAEFENPDRSLCITDIMLTLSPLPAHPHADPALRWLKLRAYRLPAPVKATTILMRGTTREAADYLDPVPQYLLILGRSSVVQMCSRSEGAMRWHCDRNKRTQMYDAWPRRR